MGNGNWKLVTESGAVAVVGGEYETFSGEKVILSGGRPPHKPSSTGKVYLRHADGTPALGEFYPSVIKLKWVEVPQGA